MKKVKVTDGNGQLFGTFRRESRRLSDHLERKLRVIHDALTKPGGIDFTLPDEAIVAGLLKLIDEVDPPSVASVSKHGPAQLGHYGRTKFRFCLVVQIEGSAELVNHWPDLVPEVAALAYDPDVQESGMDAEPPHWRWRADSEIEYRYEYLQDDPSDPTPDVASSFGEQQARALKIVEAIASQTRDFLLRAQSEVKAAVATRRALNDAANKVFDTIALPKYSPPEFEPVIVDDPTPEPEATPLPPRLLISENDWTTYLHVVARWADAIERNPQSFRECDEYTLRDLLLATLHAVYPVALGEVMTAGLKSDIYVIADPSRPQLRPIITELKVWDGASKLPGDLEQLFDQTTVRESRCALLYFIKRNSVTKPLADLHAAVQKAPGFQGWQEDPTPDTWPTADFVVPDDSHRQVAVTVGHVFIDTSKRTAMRGLPNA